MKTFLDPVVSLETAKLISSEAYTYPVEYVYKDGILIDYNIVQDYTDSYLAPSLGMFLRFLRDERNINIIPKLIQPDKWTSEICIISENSLNSFDPGITGNSWEDVVEKTIKYIYDEQD